MDNQIKELIERYKNSDEKEMYYKDEDKVVKYMTSVLRDNNLDFWSLKDKVSDFIPKNQNAPDILANTFNMTYEQKVEMLLGTICSYYWGHFSRSGWMAIDDLDTFLDTRIMVHMYDRPSYYYDYGFKEIKFMLENVIQCLAGKPSIVHSAIVEFILKEDIDNKDTLEGIFNYFETEYSEDFCKEAQYEYICKIIDSIDTKLAQKTMFHYDRNKEATCHKSVLVKLNTALYLAEADLRIRKDVI